MLLQRTGSLMSGDDREALIGRLGADLLREAEQRGLVVDWTTATVDNLETFNQVEFLAHAPRKDPFGPSNNVKVLTRATCKESAPNLTRRGHVPTRFARPTTVK